VQRKHVFVFFDFLRKTARFFQVATALISSGDGETASPMSNS
jgi:hypothetical protein